MLLDIIFLVDIAILSLSTSETKNKHVIHDFQENFRTFSVPLFVPLLLASFPYYAFATADGTDFAVEFLGYVRFCYCFLYDTNIFPEVGGSHRKKD